MSISSLNCRLCMGRCKMCCRMRALVRVRVRPLQHSYTCVCKPCCKVCAWVSPLLFWQVPWRRLKYNNQGNACIFQVPAPFYFGKDPGLGFNTTKGQCMYFPGSCPFIFWQGPWPRLKYSNKSHACIRAIEPAKDLVKNGPFLHF